MNTKLYLFTMGLFTAVAYYGIGKVYDHEDPNKVLKKKKTTGDDLDAVSVADAKKLNSQVKENLASKVDTKEVK